MHLVFPCAYCKAKFNITARLKQHMEKEREEKVKQQAQAKTVRKDKISPFFSLGGTEEEENGGEKVCQAAEA